MPTSSASASHAAAGAASATPSGRPFLQIPGPTNVPDRVLRAMDRPVIDHRGPDFAALTHELLPPLRRVFGTSHGDPILFPGSGTGAWEAALVNVLAPGDRILAFNYGHFSAQFNQTARNLGFQVDEVPLRWGQALPPEEVETRLRADRGAAQASNTSSASYTPGAGSTRPYKAVLVVQNETSTGVLSDIGAIRSAMDAAGHDALLIVDAVSALGSTPFELDAWRVDVALAGSQKGLMLPPGLALLCIGPRAREAAEKGGSPRHYWDWRPILRDNAAGFFPYTPATLLLFGLREALRMLVEEEGLDRVYARHQRLAHGVRAAVEAWAPAGVRLFPEALASASPTLTAIAMPPRTDSDAVIRHARERFGLSLGVGLSQIKGKVLRIGHLGALNELEVIGTLGGLEIALKECGLPLSLGAGVSACQQTFLTGPQPANGVVSTAAAGVPAETAGAASGSAPAGAAGATTGSPAAQSAVARP